MSRPPRAAEGGLIYHALNRAVARARIFNESSDYEAFLDTLAQATARYDMRVLAYCIMPNHFHLVLWPRADGDLSHFMRWLTMTHTQRWHAYRRSAGAGHLYQGRFKSFPVQDDGHFLALCRYVERNALRARLVPRAEDWLWGSPLGAETPGPPPLALPSRPGPSLAPETGLSASTPPSATMRRKPSSAPFNAPSLSVHPTGNRSPLPASASSPHYARVVAPERPRLPNRAVPPPCSPRNPVQSRIRVSTTGSCRSLLSPGPPPNHSQPSREPPPSAAYLCDSQLRSAYNEEWREFDWLHPLRI